MLDSIGWRGPAHAPAVSEGSRQGWDTSEPGGEPTRTALPRSRSLSITYGNLAMTVGVRLRDETPFSRWRRGRTVDEDAGELPTGPLLAEELTIPPDELPEPPEDVLPLEERRGLDGRRPSVVMVRPQR